MGIRAHNHRRQLAVATSTVAALGVAGFAPTQAAIADPPSRAAATVGNHQLVVTGTAGPDDIQITVGADPTRLLVDLGHGAAPAAFDRATFSSITVVLGNGDDTFTASRTAGVTEPVTVDAGNGDDAITGGAGTDTIFGGSGDDSVDGGRGTDTEVLGHGDDTAAWLPGEGNDVVEGGSGHDTLMFVGSNGNEKFDVSANGTRALLTRDVGTIRMDLDGVEALTLAALGGVDHVTTHDLTGTGLTQEAIDLSAAGTGDGQPDTVAFDGTAGADHVDVTTDGNAVDVTGLAVNARVTGAEGIDELQFATGDGDDTVHVADAVANLIGVAVDLGSGQTT